MKHVAILYNHDPSGHSQAAKALEEAFHSLKPDIKVSRLDLSSGIHPWVGPVVAAAYYKLLQTAPGIWDKLYDNQKVAGAAKPLLDHLRQMEAKKIRPFLRSRQPDAVVTTQALPCNVAAFERRTGHLDTPLIGVLTDYLPHHYWIDDGVDAYCAPSEDAARDLTSRGVAPGKVQVTGIPISQAYSRLPTREAAKRKLGLPLDRPTVLVTGGTHGLGRMEESVKALERVNAKPHILAVCGGNEDLVEKLKKRKRPELHVYSGLEKRMPELMAAADLFVGKSGGLTSSEALAAGLPMVIYAPIPGQEEHNASYLVARGAAVRATDPAGLQAVLSRLLEDPSKLSAMSASARAASRPDAAIRAASTVLKLMGILVR